MQNTVKPALTLAQAKAFESLLRQAREGWPARTKWGDVATGCNTTVLHGLRKAGLINVSRIYLHGHVSADIKIGATR